VCYVLPVALEPIIIHAMGFNPMNLYVVSTITACEDCS
jgi:hypothetical protein